MQAGQGVTAIWNDVLPEGLDAFRAWHLREHMPERVALPGFRRGRRLVAADGATRPTFFTLYETDGLHVLRGADYAQRLNAMTPWTQRVMGTIRGTARALAEVVESHGAGVGGAMLTLRFDAREDAAPLLIDQLCAVAQAPGVAAAHLCRTDADASRTGTAEQRTRQGDAVPPGWFILVEAADRAALDGVLPDGVPGALGRAERGLYRLELLLDRPAAVD